jgi:NitT/TauT family transport system substrate-binding protein
MSESKMAVQRGRTLVVILAVLILLAAGAGWWWSKQATTSPVRKLVIAQAGDFFLYAPLYIAVDAGFFRDRQLDVSLVSTGGDEKTWAAVIGGSASFGVADPTFVPIADSRGQPGRVVASIVNGVPFWGITYKADVQPLSNAKDLKPFSVATFPSPSTAFTLQKRMFMEAGLPPNIREGAFGTLVTMIKAGQADIALELEPNVSQAVSDGAKVVYAMPEQYGSFAITGLTASPKLISENANLVRDVVCALQQALDYARDKPEESLAILAKRFPEIKPEIARAAFDRVVKAGIVPTSVVVDASAWQKAIALRVEVGDISQPKAMEAYVDNTFAQAAEKSCRAAQ